MPAGVLHGVAAWPGAIAIESCTYTISHGISPGTAIVRMLPQASFPAMEGDLVITDGAEAVTIRRCKVASLKVDQDEGGQIWTLEILDRRWRWAKLGYISGCYNALDPRGKLIPWTIRSPQELAEVCLGEMGENNYELRLPPGLPRTIGDGIPNFLSAGANFPPTGVNPPVNWQGTPPAQALQQVAEMFGCRVIFRLHSDSILVAPVGIGTTLPPGSVHKQGPSLKSPQTPDGVGVIGAPTRYQCRLRLEAVGEEWDGSYQPIDLLSYTPLIDAARQENRVVIRYNPDDVGIAVFSVDIQTAPDDPVIHVETTARPGDNAQTIAQRLADGVNNRFANAPGTLRASAIGGTLAVEGVRNGFAYDLRAQVAGGNVLSDVEHQLIRAGARGRRTWDFTNPGTFFEVQATDRLSRYEAIALARRSVWRLYRVSDLPLDADVHAAEGDAPPVMNIPGYGDLARKQQIVLTDTKVDQIRPAPRDPAAYNPSTLETVLQNYYDGYSRDQPAVVIGSIYAQLQQAGDTGVAYVNYRQNTPADRPIHIPFTIDANYQLVRFGRPVYWLGPRSAILEPFLVLETAVLVRDAETNALTCYTQVVPLAGRASLTNPQMRLCPDVQLNVTSTYSVQLRNPDRFINEGVGKHTVTGTRILEDDPIRRADYYLKGLARQYQLSQAQTIEYNGIKRIDLDGAISQVTWSVGSGGASTTASRGTEHDHWVPSYPARRRAEFLPAIPPRVNVMGGAGTGYEADVGAILMGGGYVAGPIPG
jgi:hypothetical protein